MTWGDRWFDFTDFMWFEIFPTWKTGVCFTMVVTEIIFNPPGYGLLACACSIFWMVWWIRAYRRKMKSERP